VDSKRKHALESIGSFLKRRLSEGEFRGEVYERIICAGYDARGKGVIR
jgi:hypothetical protein